MNEKRFDEINNRISEVDIQIVKLIMLGYQNYLTTGDSAAFESACRQANINPVDYIYWYNY